MAQATVASVEPAEKVRRWLAPAVAILASILGMTCMLSLVDVARSTVQLAALDEHFAGWMGVGAMAAVATAALALLSGDRVGSGPFLALGAVAALVGASLAHQLRSGAVLALAAVICGCAVGALLGGVVALVSTLPGSLARLTLTAWAAPLVVAGPLMSAAMNGRGAGPLPSLTVHPPTWVLVALTALIASWSVLTMLVEPVPDPDATRASWRAYGWIVVALASVAALVAAVLGFYPQLPLVWLRPIVVSVTAAVAAGWMLTGRMVRDPAVRLAYVAVSAVAWVVPTTALFAVSVSEFGRGEAGFVTPVLVAAAAGGVVIGYRRAFAVIPLGFALMAVAGCGTWVMASTTWVMLVSVAPLVFAGTAVLVSAVGLVGDGGQPGRIVGLALIGALVLGHVVAIPLDWAMLGDVPGDRSDMFASGRLDAGFTVAVASLSAAWTWIVLRRLQWVASRPPGPTTAVPRIVSADRR